MLSASALDRLQYMTQRMTEVAVLAGAYLAIATFAVAAPILRLLGGAEYEVAAPVLRIEAFALVPAFLAQVWLMTLIALGRLAVLAVAVASAIGAVSAAALALILIYSHAARGAAIAAVAGEAAIAIVLLAFLSVSRPGNLLSLRFVWKPTPAATALLLIMTVDLGPWIDSVLGSVAFVALVALTRAIPRRVPRRVSNSLRLPADPPDPWGTPRPAAESPTPGESADAGTAILEAGSRHPPVGVRQHEHTVVRLRE